jgi:hypothetical protein
MTVLHKLQGFFEELRLNGVPITPSNEVLLLFLFVAVNYLLIANEYSPA